MTFEEFTLKLKMNVWGQELITSLSLKKLINYRYLLVTRSHKEILTHIKRLID